MTLTIFHNLTTKSYSQGEVIKNVSIKLQLFAIKASVNEVNPLKNYSVKPKSLKNFSRDKLMIVRHRTILFETPGNIADENYCGL